MAGYSPFELEQMNAFTMLSRLFFFIEVKTNKIFKQFHSICPIGVICLHLKQ